MRTTMRGVSCMSKAGCTKQLLAIGTRSSINRFSRRQPPTLAQCFWNWAGLMRPRSTFARRECEFTRSPRTIHLQANPKHVTTRNSSHPAIVKPFGGKDGAKTRFYLDRTVGGDRDHLHPDR